VKKTIVFLGPTLPVSEARHLLPADFRPPVSQGDVLRAVDEAPAVIAIIDGYFERVPAVWHKEILWAMSQGIHVFGAASMGALRAAELVDFGMVGVGRVFEDFRNGVLEADDEVAVAHAPAEKMFRPLSDALVNIRATLAVAASQGVILSATHVTLLQIARTMFYPERRYERLLGEGARCGLPTADLDSLAGWLPKGRVDQKRVDAQGLLECLAKDAARDLPPKTVTYRFERTDAWLAAQRSR
jgi:hypothetical protein